MMRARSLTIDQLVSSTSNFLWFVAVAAGLSADGLGAFSVASGLFAVSLSAARTTSSERIVTIGTSERVALMTTSLAVIIACTVAGTAILAAFFGSDGVTVWLVAGPVILIQDRCRYVAIETRPAVAIASDAAWLVCVVGSWIGALATDAPPSTWLWLSSVIGPSAGVLIALIGCAGRLVPMVDHDWDVTRSEVPYVVDGWLTAATVFAILALLGAVRTLAEVAETRMLLLVYQPLFSLAYVGRWLVLRPGSTANVSRWPLAFAVLAGLYAVAAGGLLLLLRAMWPDVELLQIGGLSFLLISVGHVARALHQGIADLARRTTATGLLVSRAVFALVASVSAAALAARAGVAGVSLALMLGFTAGAATATRSMVRTDDRRTGLALPERYPGRDV